MAIYEVSDIDVLQRCDRCGVEHRATIGDLEVGIVRGEQVDANIVRLPACACGATEFLVRSAEVEEHQIAEGTFSHLHRMLVDHLHAELVAARKIEAMAEPERVQFAPARPLPQAIRDRWFPKGMKIETR